MDNIPNFSRKEAPGILRKPSLWGHSEDGHTRPQLSELQDLGGLVDVDVRRPTTAGSKFREEFAPPEHQYMVDGSYEKIGEPFELRRRVGPFRDKPDLSEDEAVEVIVLANPDPHSGVDLGMEMEQLRIQGFNSAIHLEEKRRIAKEEGKVERDVEKHLKSAPPSSPTNYIPSIFGRSLNNKDWADLIATVEQLHKLGENLKAHRQWWTDNRAEWIQKREELRQINADIENLQHQREGKKDSDPVNLGLKHQVNKKQKQKSVQLQWFKRNFQKMDGVYTQFRKIKEDTDSISNPRRPLPSPPSSLAYSIAWSEAIRRSIGNGDWTEARIKKWLNHSREHVTQSIKLLEEIVPTYTTSWDKAIDDLGKIIKEIEDNQRHSGSFDRIYERRIRDSKRGIGRDPKSRERSWLEYEYETEASSWNKSFDLERGIMEEVHHHRASKLELLNAKRKNKELALSIFQHITNITNQRLVIMRTLLIRLDNVMRDHMEPISSKEFSQFHQLCCTILSRDQTAGRLGVLLREILTSGIVDSEHIEAVRAHFDEGLYHHNREYGTNLQGQGSDHYAHELRRFDEEHTELKTLYEAIRSQSLEVVPVLISKDFGDEIIPVNSELPRTHKRARRTVSFMGLLRPKRSFFSLPWTNGIARDTLYKYHQFFDTEGTPRVAQLCTMLWDFMSQPDINDRFRFLRGVSRREFIDLLNSLSKHQFKNNEVEAFLFHSIITKKLRFMIDKKGKLSSVEQGWEFVDEVLLNPHTIARQSSPLIPHPDFQRLEDFLSRNDHREKITRKSDGRSREGRDISENNIINAVLKWSEPFAIDALKEYFQYYHLTGRRFKYVKDGERTVVRLIDSGWDDLPVDYQYSLFKSENLPPYLDHMDAYINSEEVRIAIATTIRNNPDWRPGAWEVWYGLVGKHKITPNPLWIGTPPEQINIDFHRFQVWLRWCTERRLFFHVNRNQELKFYRDGWSRDCFHVNASRGTFSVVDIIDVLPDIIQN